MHNKCQKKMGENCRDFDFCPHSTKPSVSLILTHMDVLAAKMRTRCVKSSHTETSPPPPSSPVHAFILVFLHPILPVFPLPEIKRGGKNGKINHEGPERCLWWVLTLGQFAVVGLGETSHHVSTSHVQNCSLYKILHISWDFLKAGSWDIR